MEKETSRMLIEKAAVALEQAYAPYSRYRVGAALISEDGEIFTGCNMENASYGLTMCAERNAFAAAIEAGARNFRAMAVVADGKETPYPCGACRQVMAEFCGDDFVVLAARIEDAAIPREFQLAELLPVRFRKHSADGQD